MSKQEVTVLSIDSLTIVTGGGTGGQCDDLSPTYNSPQEGAGRIASAVYVDTKGKLPTEAQMRGAESSLTLGRDWNQLCARIRKERAPGWQP